MTKPTIIKTSIANNDVTISDNQGNSFHHNGGFIDATCNGAKQDVNVVAIATIAAKLGIKAGLSQAEQPAVPSELFKSPPGNFSPIPQFSPSDVDSPLFAGQIMSRIASSIQSVDATVTLKEGLPSPLATLCTRGQQEGILKTRH